MKVMEVLEQKISRYIPCSFAYKLVYVDDKFTKPMLVYRGKNAAYKFIKAILREYEYCKKVKKKKKKNFSQATRVRYVKNSLKITMKKLEITGKFRFAVHWSCNINLQLTKKFLVMFKNLIGYEFFMTLKNSMKKLMLYLMG